MIETAKNKLNGIFCKIYFYEKRAPGWQIPQVAKITIEWLWLMSIRLIVNK